MAVKNECRLGNTSFYQSVAHAFHLVNTFKTLLITAYEDCLNFTSLVQGICSFYSILKFPTPYFKGWEEQ